MNRIFKLLLALSLVFSLVFNAVGCELVKNLDFSSGLGGIFGNTDEPDNEQSNGEKNDAETPDDNDKTEKPNDDTDNPGGNSGDTSIPDGDGDGTDAPGGNSGSTSTPDGDKTENPGEDSAGSSDGNTGTGDEKGEVVYKDVRVDAYGGFTVPAYSGNAYYVINNNQTFFTPNDITTSSYERYDALDSLGRVTLAMSCLGADLMPTEEREDISEVKPTGWNQATYSVISGGYLYNRCHMIAFQLTGENVNHENLITGTAYFNKTMIPFENQIADYIKETKNHVMYRITPVFTGDNLLADGIILEAYSVEDEGDGISFNLFIYNVQPKVDIDYATGKSASIDPEDKVEVETPTTSDYVLNTNSKKIHTTDCRHVKNMSDENKQEYSGNIQTLLDEGYTKCNTCNPK